MIVKDVSKGQIPSNFHPITCLPTLWKLLSSILAGDLYCHLSREGLLPCEQKGCTKGSQGAKDQLLIDKMIMTEAKRRHKNLQMMWVDYRKAYDSVPHIWIIECLQLMKAHSGLRTFVKESMKCWKTQVTTNGISLGSVKIN